MMTPKSNNGTELTLDRGGARMYHLQSTASESEAFPSFPICPDSTIPSDPPI